MPYPDYTVTSFIYRIGSRNEYPGEMSYNSNTYCYETCNAV